MSSLSEYSHVPQGLSMIGSDGFFWKASKVKYEEPLDSNRELCYEAILFVEVEWSLWLMQIGRPNLGDCQQLRKTVFGASVEK